MKSLGLYQPHENLDAARETVTENSPTHEVDHYGKFIQIILSSPTAFNTGESASETWALSSSKEYCKHFIQHISARAFSDRPLSDYSAWLFAAGSVATSLKSPNPRFNFGELPVATEPCDRLLPKIYTTQLMTGRKMLDIASSKSRRGVLKFRWSAQQSGSWINYFPKARDVQGYNTSKLVAEFNERADRWEGETAIYSSPGSTYLHKDYIYIIGKGMSHKEIIIPLILERIPVSGSDWFFALQTIAGENPAEDATNFSDALKAWSDWTNLNVLSGDETTAA